ncbi:MAG: cyclic nucleotide-binding domain-containing protein [bacterium]|nr:cyclic nucleotide-binding domain-containing protein [Gammaproteobacteria bacterium]HIL95618.1 cyclic nucleotide-binding domain-containing protein [Pseudomonadales bacterium]
MRMAGKDLEPIRHLVPFDEKSDDELKQIMAKARMDTYPKGKVIFKRGEKDRYVYWLLSGTVDLLDQSFDAKSRAVGDEAASYPIDNNNPHRLTLVCKEKTRVLVIDRADSGLLSSGMGASDYTVSELEETEAIDWMTTLLSSPLFEFIPPANIQSLFSRFEEVKYKARDVVIRQKEPGDYFYVIQAGRVRVERTAGERTMLLAELKTGDNFGQDALISDVPRNATVTMITDGIMMRLSETEFERLLMDHLVETVSLEEAQQMIKKWNPKTYILDVRNPNEAKTDKIEGAINVPVLLLRKNLHKLKADAVYVTAAEGGRRADLAAYILNENGYTAYVLR